MMIIGLVKRDIFCIMVDLIKRSVFKDLVLWEGLYLWMIIYWRVLSFLMINLHMKLLLVDSFYNILTVKRFHKKINLLTLESLSKFELKSMLISDSSQ